MNLPSELTLKLSLEKLEDIKLRKKNTYTRKLFCAAFVYEIRNT